MTRFRRLRPEGLPARFLLLLAAALLAANLIALALLSLDRLRAERDARTDREIGRIVSLVPAMDALDARARARVARDASTRFTRVSVDPRPVVRQRATAARSAALTEALTDALPGREIRAAVMRRDDSDDHDRWRGHEVVAISARLSGTGASQWLNLVSRGGPPRPPGIETRVFVLLLGLSLAFVLGVAWLFLRRLTRPLRALTAATRAAGHGDRSARVPETGARELRDLAGAFNDMQDRIAAFDAERMRTLAAVGHDLRTPITSLRIRAEMLDADDAAPMIRTLDEMTVMADGLVAYAKGSGHGEAMQRVDLADLLVRLCADRGATLAPSGPVHIRARPVALGRALGNLIDNAVRYGTAARVTLDTTRGSATVRIEDDGPGIAPEKLGAIFDPFVRGEDSRSQETGGAGLGLSIARNIVTAHGGTVTLENRAGGGLSAIVTLPRQPAR